MPTRGEGVHERLGIAEALGDTDRLRAPSDRPLEIGNDHAELATSRISAPQLTSETQRLQQPNSLPDHRLGLRRATGLAQRPRQRTQHAPQPSQVAKLAPQRRRPLERVDRLIEPVGQKALIRAKFQQLRGCLSAQAIGEPKRPRVVRRRLAMRARRSRARRRSRRPPQHRLGVADRFRVMRQPRRIRLTHRLGATSAASAARCRASPRSGATDSSTASRASSCRNATPPSTAISIPDARHSSNRSTNSPASASSNHNSTRPGTTATACSSLRAGSDKRPARAKTASRTVSGIPSPPASSTSVTKKGLPPVLRYSSRPSTPCGPASSATATGDSGATFSRTGRPRQFAKHNPKPLERDQAHHRESSPTPAPKPIRPSAQATSRHPTSPHPPNANPRAPTPSARASAAPRSAPPPPHGVEHPPSRAPRTRPRSPQRHRTAVPTDAGSATAHTPPTAPAPSHSATRRTSATTSSCQPRPHPPPIPAAPQRSHNPSKRFLQHRQTISTLEKHARTHPRAGTRGLTRRLRQPLDHSATSFARASSTDHTTSSPKPTRGHSRNVRASPLSRRKRPRPLRLAERTPSRPASRLPDRTSSHSVGSAACFSKLPMHGCGMTTSRTSSSPTGPSSRNRVEARAQPHPPAPRSPPRAALSLARERFAEKQASGSRPCPVARRSRYRPNPSVRDHFSGTTAFICSSTRRSALAIEVATSFSCLAAARRTAASPG